MACTKCKKQREKEKILGEMEKTERFVKVIFLGVVLLAAYGIYSLISHFL